ncbi:MAG: YceD family protein [Pseudomonadota bacterium]
MNEDASSAGEHEDAVRPDTMTLRLAPMAAIESAPVEVEFAASDADRAAIAERLGVEAVAAFSGRVRLARRGSDVLASGAVSARLVRLCSATLEPFEEVIEEAVDLRLAAELTEEDETSTEDVDALAPPFLAGDQLDVTEILIQQASLGMAPFPRAPTAALDAPMGDSEREAPLPEGRQRPFAGLQDMLKRRPSED